MMVTLSKIAELTGGTVSRNPDITVSGLSPIEHIQQGTLVYAEGLENVKKAEQSEASAILVSKQTASEHKPVIQVPHPLKAFIFLLDYFHPKPKQKPGIHPTAVIDENVTLGKEVYIGPHVHIESGCVIGDHCQIKSHVYIGAHVSIGSHTILYPNVTIYDRCQIGSRVSIHASTIIGADGFGYKYIDGEHVKIPHIGNVIIGDDVEIGANSAIDRATLGSTVIGNGTKIDNLVQIAHSVKLGEHNIVCGFTGIAGSTTSEKNVIFAANVGVGDHVRIGDNVILLAGSNVPSNKQLLPNNMYLGSPARPRKKALELELGAARISGMSKNLRTLSEKVDKISRILEDME